MIIVKLLFHEFFACTSCTRRPGSSLTSLASGAEQDIIIDDTDTRATDADMREFCRRISPSLVGRFPGFADAYFFAREATIVWPAAGLQA